MRPTCSPVPLVKSLVDIFTPPSNTQLPVGVPGVPHLTFTVSSNRHRRTSMNWHPYNNLVVHNPSDTVVDIYEYEGDIFDLME